MKDFTDHKKIVVLIDADNAQHSKIKTVLNEISTHGHVISKRAYGDWSSPHLKNWKSILNELAIQPVQQFSYTTGKNSTDAALIIDAMDLLFTAKYDAFVIISSDSDFTKLASRLRESEIYVFGVGEKKPRCHSETLAITLSLQKTWAIQRFPCLLNILKKHWRLLPRKKYRRISSTFCYLAGSNLKMMN